MRAFGVIIAVIVLGLGLAFFLNREVGMLDGVGSSTGDGSKTSTRNEVAPHEKETAITPSSFDSKSGDPETTTTALSNDALVVRVEDPDGRPVPGASVGVCPLRSTFVIGDPLPMGVTGADGQISFSEIPSGDVRVVVCAQGRLPVRSAWTRTAPRVVIVLEGESSLDGVVRIGTELPEQPITLTLTGFSDPTTGEDWTTAERHFCAACSRTAGQLNVTTDSEGKFFVFGFENDETVQLGVPEAFEVVNPLPPAFTTPRREAVIVLKQRRLLRGVAMQRPGGPPTFGLSAYILRSVVIAPDGTKSEREDGIYAGAPFAFPLDDRPIEAVMIEISAMNDRKLLARRTLAVAGRPGDVDLGTIEFPDELPHLQVRLVESNGRGIENGRVRSGARVSGKTDAEGRTNVLPSDGEKTLYAGAFGYEVVAAPLPASLTEPLEIVLKRTNRLTLAFRRPDGKLPVRGLKAALLFALPLPENAPERFPEFADIRGAVNGGLIHSDSRHQLVYDLPDDGRIVLSGWPENVPFDLMLTDAHGLFVLKETHVIGPASDLEIARTLPRNPRTLTYAVTDVSGAAIVGASVSIGISQYPTSKASDREGRVVFEDVIGDVAVMVLSAKDKVTRVVQSAAPDGTTFVLKDARTVWVELLDRYGERVDGEVVVEGEPAQRFNGTRTGKGMYRVDGVPKDEKFSIVGHIQGVERREPLWPNQERARIVDLE